MKNNMDKMSIIMGSVWGAVALFTMLVVKVIAPVCTGLVETIAGKQVPMRCHYTGVAVFMMAVLMLTAGITVVVTKQKRACGIMVIVISALMFLSLNIETGMGVCANLDMACNMTVPFVKLSATVGVVSGIVALILGKKK